MSFYQAKLDAFRAFLGARGYRIRTAKAQVSDPLAAPVTVQFDTSVLGKKTLIAVPDVHISDGTSADIFLNGDARNVTRFTATLRAVADFMAVEGADATVVQLGDWYDVWRAIGKDATQAQFAKIDNVPQYQQLLQLDKDLSLAHVIGNHDASFTHALPDRRVADAERFRFGFGLMQSNGRCFALHGHQTDAVTGHPSPPQEQQVIWLASLAARYVTSEVRSLQEFFDKEGINVGAAFGWLTSLVGLNRPDPAVRPRGRRAAPSTGFRASCVEREQSALLVKIAVEACKKLYASPNELALLVVGHSHRPCISWTPHPDTANPVAIVDAGSWVYGAAQLLFGADDRVSVFDILKN